MNILVIGSHPDDFEYGCGGTILKFKKLYKANIFVLVMTQGGIGSDSEIRRKEQEKVCSIIDAKLFWGDCKDTEVEVSKDTINKVEKVIKNSKPDLIFAHYPYDTHQDHRNVSQITITATRYMKNVLFFETPTSIDFSPTVFVDIGSVLKSKMKLLLTHKSQVQLTRVKHLSLTESVISYAIFRGYQDRVKYAEGFVPLRLSLDFHI